jgi:hypothetical protein
MNGKTKKNGKNTSREFLKFKSFVHEYLPMKLLEPEQRSKKQLIAISFNYDVMQTEFVYAN